MKESPKIHRIIKNDTSVFMCTVVPLLFGILFTVLFIKSEINKEQLTALEFIYYGIATFLAVPIVLLPFVLWWVFVIFKTFSNGVELTASSERMKMPLVIGLGIEYIFEYEGKKIKHVASLIRNKEMQVLAKEKTLAITYNPKKGISFVKAAYI